MRIQIVDGEIVLSEVYNGIGIQTDMGLFGVAQRNGGIEVLHDGKPVWASHDYPGSVGIAGMPFHQSAADALRRARLAVVGRFQRCDHENPASRKYRSYLVQALEAIDAARRILHDTLLLDDSSATEKDSPYYRTLD